MSVPDPSPVLTEHALLVPFGRFAQQIGLIEALGRVPVRMKTATTELSDSTGRVQSSGSRMTSGLTSETCWSLWGPPRRTPYRRCRKWHCALNGTAPDTLRRLAPLRDSKGWRRFGRVEPHI